MSSIGKYVLASFLSLAAVGTAFGQETQTRVVDEVVAQVNDGVITLSRVKRETKNIVDSYVQQGKTPEEAQRMVSEKQAELIANLINEELLIQRAKEAGMESDIEASINRRFKDILDQEKIATLGELYTAMKARGIDPDDLRDNWRKQATRDRVLQREVSGPIYWRFTPKELKDYYEKNKQKFTKPETVSISELFLGYAGRDEAAVKAKAAKLYNDLKAGGDWDKIVKESGDPAIISQGIGKLEDLKVADLVDTLSNPLKGLKKGDYTAPFEADKLGMVILRVDARTSASSESVFDENAVRLALLSEKQPEEQKKFMAKLREESYIKISDTYRPSVSPVLFSDERKDKTAN